uniref:Glutathione hydrolase n=1 Tax=Catharus ustulatus TaxID=91951 RepID=A0A8C3VBM8_CATUS
VLVCSSALVSLLVLSLGIQGAGWGIFVLMSPESHTVGTMKRIDTLTGENILKSGGTAVDAAIAGLICTSVMNPQSSGLGGGVVFTIYNASTGAVEVINARETVPRVFPDNLLSGCNNVLSCSSDARWIGVPGELRGYEEAHKRHGRLPWKALFEPTIKLLSEPLTISPVLHRILHHPLFSRPGESPLLCDGQRFLRQGETFQWQALKQTLQTVAEQGAAAFYEGEIGRTLVQDIREAGSNLTLEDLRAYKAEVSSALNITLNNHTKVFAPGPPMGGAVLMFILKVLEGKFLMEKGHGSLATPEEKVQTYHYIAEALKFGNMLRPHMRDPSLLCLQVPLGTLLSDQFAEFVRKKIDNHGNHSISHYSLMESLYNDKYRSMGTSHISVLAADSSAVSATSTINYPFGSFVYSRRTGIILNNELADFCIANRSIKAGEHPYPQNKAQPHGKNISASALGEKPTSAMVPSILISKSGDMLVIGGAGGGWIISATTMGIINKLWFGYDLEHAISAPVMHTRGDSVLFEESFSKEVKTGLLGRGHKEKKDALVMNVVQGISKEGKCISAYSDKRKLGKSAGY